MGLDFSQLYSLLDLEPGCSLEELKHAYRKRVAELHPDRHAFRADAESGDVQLATLTPLYRMALQFHESHGRLPGSAAATAAASGPLRATRRAMPRPPDEPPSEQAPRIPASHRWLLIGLACLVAWLVFGTSAPPA